MGKILFLVGIGGSVTTVIISIVVIIAFNVQRRHLKVNLEKEYGIQINEDNDERKLK